jgi:hypothetical protein
MRKRLLFHSKRNSREAGVALITSLLLLFLMSSLLVGFMILLASNQQLAGSNNDDVTAFYAAEAGLEQMTSNLGDLFAQTYSPTGAQITAIQTNPPLVPGIQFTDTNGTGYSITAAAYDSNGNPAPTVATIKSGTYVGMTALLTEYTMVVNARTTSGREVKLQRTTQTVGIPMFQFGIFSNTDLDFFPGPNFNFGGRTHTNGNLFLAAGSTVTLSDKVDAYKDVIRTNLENGWPTSSNYTGTVQITTQPGGTNYRSLGTNEGSLTGTLGSGADTKWPTISTGSAPTDYNSNLVNGAGSAFPQYATGAKQLNLGIVTIGGGSTQSIDLMRRPMSGEASNITGERYFAQASLKVLLSDDPADIMNLPCIDSSTQPFDLSKLAQTPDPVNGTPWTTAGYYAPAKTLWNAMIANHVTPLPLAASGAAGGYGGAYSFADGYWLPQGYPIIQGYLKIEEQTAYGSPCGTWKDVTVEILSYGYVGRNINPVPQSLDGANMNPQWPGTATAMDPLTGETESPYNALYPNQLSLPAGSGYPLPTLPHTTAQAPIQLDFQNGPTLAAGNMSALDVYGGTTGTCKDPHPNAVIRLERIRDNPSTLYTAYHKPTTTWINYVASGTQGSPASNQPRQAPVAVVCGVDPTTGDLPVIADQNGHTAKWSPQPWDFWPNMLFDTREGTLRDSAMANGSPSNLPPATLNGAMHYIEVDGANLANWFGGKIGTLTTSGQATADPAVAPNNFLVYFSDRRGNYTSAQTITGGWPPLSYTKKESGEYGWNDLVNFSSSATAGCPNASLDNGEDVDQTSVLYTYGASQQYIHAVNGQIVAPATSVGLGQIGLFKNLVGSALTSNANCATAPSYVTDSIWPMMVPMITGGSNPNAIRENPALFFRRAVKIVNGKTLTGVNICVGGNSCGLSIAAENPVYIQGDYNANSGGNGFSDPSIATSVAGDAVTLLSNSWNDTNSFSSPYVQTARVGITTWYRVAVIGGAPPYFSNPSGTVSQDYGTDGGVHNFLRYIESWSGGNNTTLNYMGSIIDLYYSRQANSTFKCCTTVYSPPTRGYNFDTNFLTPALLPPRTPLFRDVNTTGWTRLLTPNASSGNE